MSSPLDDGTKKALCTPFHAPARTRTWNSSLEARHDHPFHHQGITFLDAPTRTRTRDSSLGPRCDCPLHHQGDLFERKARDSNPHSPRGNRISNAARPTVSGYLPGTIVDRKNREWTAGESNPDFLVAGQVSSRWTSSPLFSKPRSARESNSVHLPTTEACRQRTRGPYAFMNESQSVVPEGVEPPFPLCRRGVVAIGPRDDRLQSFSSGTSGSRTHRHQILDLTAMPVRVPCRCWLNCGPGSRTTASGHMKPGRAPARPQIPDPGIEPGKSAL
jgi:hypothetical protein